MYVEDLVVGNRYTMTYDGASPMFMGIAIYNGELRYRFDSGPRLYSYPASIVYTDVIDDHELIPDDELYILDYDD
jgi:hypothetical protein